MSEKFTYGLKGGSRLQGKRGLLSTNFAHVYYSMDENDSWEKVFASGRYLSQDLLDRGLARAV